MNRTALRRAGALAGPLFAAAAFVEARRGRGAWRLASAAGGAGMLGLFVLAGAGFSGRPVPGGLYQRLSLGIGLGWVTALMLRER